MSAKLASSSSSPAAVTLPGTSHSGTTLSVLNTHAGAVVVPDHLRLLHHSA